MKLVFSKPVDYVEFLAHHGAVAVYPGIYIWGFVNDDRFVPYYVGKSEGSVYLRIISHYKKIKTANTYIIFKESFYKNLQNHLLHLPILAKPYLNLHKIEGGYFANKLIYYNNEDFLKTTYVNEIEDKSILRKELKSQNLDGKLINKRKRIQLTIDKVFHENKLFVSYCILDKLDPKNKIAFKKTIKDAETYVKFHLPNPVISDSGSLTEEVERKYTINLKF
jgi:hypothetical protein